MARYVKTLTLNKESAQVEERIQHFLKSYGFVSSKKETGMKRVRDFGKQSAILLIGMRMAY